MAYNVWRALTPPPQDFPLALCDLRTVREDHLIRADSVGNPANGGESVEFYLAPFDPGHRWCYFSDLTRDEVLLFKQFDTAASGPSGCPHTAFRDPRCTMPVATRLSGMPSITRWRNSSSIKTGSLRFVSTQPGATALTRIFGASSFDSAFVNEICPPFDAA